MPTLAAFNGSGVMKAFSIAVPLWEMARWNRPWARGDISCRDWKQSTHEIYK